MSKQLALSAAFSIFAMAAFVLSTTPSALEADGALRNSVALPQSVAGAPIEIEAPAGLFQLPKIPALQFAAD
ncbi:hypothetical protein H0274_11585 [Altererythrobacter sp. CC-YST694]|uniref:hypothetical protein n=1 Tax=Altererythrobacter sp. CC-YST694 TaxID=2755038 RepID=UPI001D007D3A|nr:hypothetical protein [Altererythrobacter sp. CC-YST694]MCB5425903.1 hypothetical protein [Altererythrobacter sp. CC-YST694]